MNSACRHPPALMANAYLNFRRALGAIFCQPPVVLQFVGPLLVPCHSHCRGVPAPNSADNAMSRGADPPHMVGPENMDGGKGAGKQSCLLSLRLFRLHTCAP
jgi:hypothetical protein